MRTRKLILLLVLLLVVGLVAGLFFGLPYACRSAGERRLIGTWELEHTATSGDATASPRQPQQPGPTTPGSKIQEFMKNLGKNLESWGRAMTPEMRVTFESNGTYSESIGLGGRRQVVTGEWEVVEGGDDRVVVRLHSSSEQDSNRATELTITFEGDDVMLYPGGAGQPLRMVRRTE